MGWGNKEQNWLHFLRTSYSNSLPVYISCAACMLENEPHTHILAHNACSTNVVRQTDFFNA